MSEWGRGLCLTATGVSADQRQHVREAIEAAGGRYSPNFSKRCTHLIVAAEQSDTSQVKVYLAGVNKEKWQAHAVRLDWLLDCTQNSCQIPEDPYKVEPPSPEKFQVLQQRLQQVAVPTVSKAAKPPAMAVLPGTQKRISSDMDVNANITTRSGSMVPSKRHKHVLLTSSQTPSTTPALAARANNTASQSRYSKAVGLTEPAVASIPKQTSVYVMPSKNRSAAPVIPAKTLQRLAHSSSHAVVHPLLPGFDSSAASTLHDTRQQLAVSQVYQGALLPNQAATSSNMSYGHQQHASNQQADTFRCTTTAAAAMPDVFTSREDLVAGKEVAAKMHALHAQAMQKAWQQQQQHSQPYIQPAANPRQAAAAAPFADASTHIRISPTLQHSGGMFAPLASSTERLNWAASVPLPSEPLSELQNPQRQQQQQQAQHRASETCKTADLSAETESLVAKLRALSSDRSANPAQGKPVNPLQQGFVYKPKAGKRSRTAITETPASTTSSAPTAQPIAGSTKHQRSLADAPVPAGAPFSRCSILKPAKHQEKGVKAVHPAEQPLHGTQSAYHIAAQLRPAAASSIDMSLQQTQTGNDHSSRQQSCPGNNHAMQSIHAPFAVHSATAKPACDAAEAPDLQGPPVSHQLGKVTPLKSSFTPRPSRFRLEAERCTPSQCCDSDSLQQVLFTSPIKEEGAADMADNMPMESSVTQTNGILLDNSKGGSQQEQAAEAAAQQNDVPMTTETAASSHDMNEAAACILETPSAAAQAIFRNMHFILDPAFLPDQQHRMSEAIKQGGGQQVASAYLGSGATHVVCQPQAAGRWLSMGLSIVSPAWLLRSLSLGTPQRCLHLSLDASRHLPSPGPTPIPADVPAQQPTAHEMGRACDLTTRQARQNLVQQLHGMQGHLDEGARHAQQAVQTPQSMLEEVLWCIRDPPEQATLEPSLSCLATSHGLCIRSPDKVADGMDMLTATQVACKAELCDAEAMCIDSSKGSDQLTDGRPGLPMQDQDWQDIVYRGASLTLLLPVDDSGACGHCSRTVQTGSQGVTRQQLLLSIHSFYQEDLSVAEQLQLLQRSRHAAEMVQEAFIEGAPVQRQALMGSKTNFEGLERVSRDLTGTIYEAKLSC